MITEKELHQRDGFGSRAHRPDFSFAFEGKTCSVEVELTPKDKERTVKNLHGNFMAYDCQMWVVPDAQAKIRAILRGKATAYPNIEVLPLEEVTAYVKQACNAARGEELHE